MGPELSVQAPPLEDTLPEKLGFGVVQYDLILAYGSALGLVVRVAVAAAAAAVKDQKPLEIETPFQENNLPEL